MKIKHYFVSKDQADSIQRQAALHRKCLLFLRARAERASAPALRKAG